jgi:uncharacterized protein
MAKLTLILQKETMAVCRLSPEEEVPAWVLKEPFYCVTHTADELSIILPQSKLPVDWKAERDWRIFKILGPLDFNLIGILASIANPLALASIPINALSTYDTDYVMVRTWELEQTCKVLEFEGFKIEREK